MSSPAAITPGMPPPREALGLFRFSRPAADAAWGDPVRAFAGLWAIGMMLSTSKAYGALTLVQGPLAFLLAIGTMGCAVALLFQPSSNRWLAALAAVALARYISDMPVGGNNQTIAAFMNVGILVVLARTPQREVAHESLRQLARGLIAIMYFFGIFHKINIGFLAPDTSCATELYTRLAAPFGLAQNEVGIWGGIWGTLILELIALVALYWRRIFWLGLLVSLPFHYIIPLSGYAWYMDFSSLVFALYALCLPKDAAVIAGTTLSRFIGHLAAPLVRLFPGLPHSLSAMLGTGALFALLLGLAALAGPDARLRLIWSTAFMFAWAAYGGVVMLTVINAALAAMPYRPVPASSIAPWWLHGIPLLFFLTCWSPYLGLKTESSVAMFSNLHTEGGVTNHLVMPAAQPFGYQKRLVTLVDGSDKQFVGSFGKNQQIVEHSLAVHLSKHPQDWVSYISDGRRHDRISWANWPHHRPSWIERSFLIFKPVDWTRPKPCTH
jgi:hypothetical protein